MIMTDMKAFKETKKDSALWNKQREVSNRCPKCLHRMSFAQARTDKLLCPYCNVYIFKDKRAEFKYRAQEQLLRRD